MPDDNKPPSEKDTEPQETLHYSANADKRVWERRVERCETDLCFYGYKIGGLRQGGRYVVVIHAEPVSHMCSFRGQITPEMEAFYNHAKT